jgi:aminopeptidase N
MSRRLIERAIVRREAEVAQRKPWRRSCFPSAPLLVALIFLLSGTSSLATRHERQIDFWKPLNYNVTLTFNDRLTEITNARTEITISILRDQVSSLDLDFGEMTVDSVTVNNRSTQFEHPAELLKVKLPETVAKGAQLVIVVVYHGKPKDGLILSHDKDDKPAAVGDNWPDRVHQWIPCFDHPSAKATVSFTVNAPARDIVVANGRLDRTENTANATRTWTYTESRPIPPYCMIVAVGEFAKLEPNSPAETPLSYYVPQSDSSLAIPGFAPAAPSLKLFSETIAPYPYEKLALIVGATRFGGMENSSAIVFASSLFDATANQPMSNTFRIRSGIVDVVAHEIAHQWFGDSVTESTWSDLWLSEGFATYFAGLFIERYEGEAAFRDYMKRAADTYFSYEKQARTPIHDTGTEDLFKLLNANNYQKGAWVLHMLRARLGDDTFFRGLRAYYNAHKNSTATTADLRAALESASGVNLSEFFARWVYGTGHPQYELSWQWNSENSLLTLHLDQVQPEASFPNWLSVDVITANGQRRVVFKPVGKKTIEECHLDQAPLSLRVDPENSVLKEIDVKPAF